MASFAAPATTASKEKRNENEVQVPLPTCTSGHVTRVAVCRSTDVAACQPRWPHLGGETVRQLPASLDEVISAIGQPLKDGSELRNKKSHTPFPQQRPSRLPGRTKRADGRGGTSFPIGKVRKMLPESPSRSLLELDLSSEKFRLSRR